VLNVASTRGVGRLQRDAVAGRDQPFEDVARFRRQRAGIIKQAPARQRRERSVEVVVLRVGELQRHAARAEGLLDDHARGLVGAEAVTGPEQPARSVPQAVARAFERDGLRHLDDVLDQTARLQRVERFRVDRLLARALGVAEAREQRLAVEHHRGVRGEHQVRQILGRRDELD